MRGVRIGIPRGVCGDPIEEQKATRKIREYPIERVGSRVRIAINGFEDLHTERGRKKNHHGSLDRHRQVKPSESFEPIMLHDMPLSLIRI